jgi:transcriptional regulator with XRE-family HTH domain
MSAPGPTFRQHDKHGGNDSDAGPPVDARLFKRWREEAGLSLREFCRRFRQKTGINIADSNLSSMEQGRRRIPDYLIEHGAEILGKTPADFPEYRLRKMPPDVLLDPFADRVLRLLYNMRHLDEFQRAELRGSARILELMETSIGYGADTASFDRDEVSPADKVRSPAAETSLAGTTDTAGASSRRSANTRTGRSARSNTGNSQARRSVDTPNTQHTPQARRSQGRRKKA